MASASVQIFITKEVGHTKFIFSKKSKTFYSGLSSMSNMKNIFNISLLIWIMKDSSHCTTTAKDYSQQHSLVNFDNLSIFSLEDQVQFVESLDINIRNESNLMKREGYRYEPILISTRQSSSTMQLSKSSLEAKTSMKQDRIMSVHQHNKGEIGEIFLKHSTHYIPRKTKKHLSSQGIKKPVSSPSQKMEFELKSNMIELDYNFSSQNRKLRQPQASQPSIYPSKSPDKFKKKRNFVPSMMDINDRKSQNVSNSATNSKQIERAIFFSNKKIERGIKGKTKDKTVAVDSVFDLEDLVSDMMQVEQINMMPVLIKRTSEPSYSLQPSISPTLTVNPSQSPSSIPTSIPSTAPSFFPSAAPSNLPSSNPTSLPSTLPSAIPSMLPSSSPSNTPSMNPTELPSALPSLTSSPSFGPSILPTTVPSSAPSSKPSLTPSKSPSFVPTSLPSSLPSIEPSFNPTSMPTFLPSVIPSSKPSQDPSQPPSLVPSISPSLIPTNTPSSFPSSQPSSRPSLKPSSLPSGKPSIIPSYQPLLSPSLLPSVEPTLIPSFNPTGAPSKDPSSFPSLPPSFAPSIIPSVDLSSLPSTSNPSGTIMTSTNPTLSSPTSPFVLEQTSEIRGKNDTIERGKTSKNRLIFSILIPFVSLAVLAFLCFYDFERDDETEENRNRLHLRTVKRNYWRTNKNKMKNRAHHISIVRNGK